MHMYLFVKIYFYYINFKLILNYLFILILNQFLKYSHPILLTFFNRKESGLSRRGSYYNDRG